MNSEWINTLRLKEAEIHLLSEWASIVGYGTVRDSLRNAESELRKVRQIFEDQFADIRKMVQDEPNP
jgi:hypothetical protein